MSQRMMPDAAALRAFSRQDDEINRRRLSGCLGDPDRLGLILREPDVLPSLQETTEDQAGSTDQPLPVL